MENKNQATSSTTMSTMSCGLCLEDRDISLTQRLRNCADEACRQCFVTWVEAKESSGEDIESVTCPFCRLNMDSRDIEECILGRPFLCQSKKQTAEDTDELTLQWLQQYTQKCPGCGAFVQKHGGCNDMTCLCGQRFCFRCGFEGKRCICAFAGPHFVDNSPLARLRRRIRFYRQTNITPRNFLDEEMRFWLLEETQDLATELKEHCRRGDTKSSLTAANDAIVTIREHEVIYNRAHRQARRVQCILLLFQKMDDNRSAFDIVVGTGNAETVKCFLGLLVLATKETSRGAPVSPPRCVPKTLYQHLDKRLFAPGSISNVLGSSPSTMELETKKAAFLHKYTLRDIERFCSRHLPNDEVETPAPPQQSKHDVSRLKVLEKGKRAHEAFPPTPKKRATPKKDLPRLVVENDIEEYKDVFTV